MIGPAAACIDIMFRLGRRSEQQPATKAANCFWKSIAFSPINGGRIRS